MADISAKLLVQIQTTGTEALKASASQLEVLRKRATEASKAAGLTEKQAAAAVRLRNMQTKGQITYESELAKLQRQRERSAFRAQAKKELDGTSSGASFFTGHGFTSRSRAVIGGLRDIGGALFAVKFGADMVGHAIMGAIEPVRHFQYALAQTQTKGKFNTEEMAAISDEAKRIGRTTQFSPTQASEAALTLAAAGMHGHDIPKTLAPVMQFAQASGLNTEESAHTFVEAGTMFGIKPAQYARIGDVLVKAANSSTASVTDLRESLKYVGPVAQAAGYDLEHTAATMALLAEGGIKGSMAGTGLARVMVGLSKQSKPAAKALASLGITQAQAQAGTQDPRKFFAMLATQMNAKGYNKAQKMAVANTLFGARGQIVALELMNAALTKDGALWKSLDEKMAHAGGTMKETADALGDTLEGKIQRFHAATETAQVTLGEKLLPTLTKLIPKLTETAIAAGSFIEHGGLGPATAGIGAAVGAKLLLGMESVSASAALGTAGAGIGTAIAGAILAGFAGYKIGEALLAATVDDVTKTNAGNRFGAAVYEVLNNKEDVSRTSEQGLTEGDNTYTPGPAAELGAPGNLREPQPVPLAEAAPQFNAVTGEIEIKVSDDRVRVFTRSRGDVKLRTGDNPAAPAARYDSDYIGL